MPIQSSFATVAEQVASFNQNIVEILSNLNSLTTTTEPSIDIRIYNSNGVLNTYSLPSFTFLKSEIERLNNSINSLYNIDTTGALIQTSSQNKFQKVVLVNLNEDPNPINNLGVMKQFNAKENFFLDSLLNPLLSVQFDLSGQIEDNVTQCLVRRYVVNFQEDTSGNFTSLGQAGINSFNQLYRQQNNIDIQKFENWYQTTPGIVNPNNPTYDEGVFSINPNSLLFDGIFNVLELEQDKLNRKLWYHLNTLDYIVTSTLQVQQLVVNDQLILNQSNASTIYSIIEISTTESNPRVRLQKVSGLQPVPVGIGTLKIYSPVVYLKTINMRIGYDERNVVFIKPINSDNNLIAKDWSQGSGFYTGDLTLSSGDSNNGQTMEQYYTSLVSDYGVLLEDLIAKKKPNVYGIVPPAPVLDPSNFKVVQTNSHLTNTANSDLIKNKHNYSTSLSNQITQIQSSITARTAKLKVTNFTSVAQQKQAQAEITALTAQKNSTSALLHSTVNDIITLTSTNPTVVPTYNLRGFWIIPDPVAAKGTTPQQIVQFRVQYRYLSQDGNEPQADTFNITQNGSTTTAVFSNWTEYKTDVLPRTFDPSTGLYTWVSPKIQDADSPNINQLDIELHENERVEVRIKSISEVGWPESPIESDWSEIMSQDYPADLNNILSNNNYIANAANNANLTNTVNNNLTAMGLDEHLSQQTTVNNVTYLHSADLILSGFKDSNGVVIDLYDYLVTLTNKITALQEQIGQSQGILQVIIIRNNTQFTISNNTTTTFNIECEEYLESFSGPNVPTGRVYANNIYIIKDFALQITNTAVSSPLGLLTNLTYQNNPDVYNTAVPQVFWVDNHDQLIFNDVSGVSNTQVDNQFIWGVNYDTITNNVVSRLAEDIGNSFVSSNSNSITDTLSLNEYNIGYGQNQPLAFIGNNNSLLDNSKWIDNSVSVGSTTKFLSTIHPLVNKITDIVDSNSAKVHSIPGGGQVVIPINIYFKMNALDNTQTGVNYQYVNLNNLTQTVKHTKNLKFYMTNQVQSQPFEFEIVFNLNRNMVTFASQPKNYTTVVK